MNVHRFLVVFAITGNFYSCGDNLACHKQTLNETDVLTDLVNPNTAHYGKIMQIFKVK